MLSPQIRRGAIWWMRTNAKGRHGVVCRCLSALRTSYLSSRVLYKSTYHYLHPYVSFEAEVYGLLISNRKHSIQCIPCCEQQVTCGIGHELDHRWHTTFHEVNHWPEDIHPETGLVLLYHLLYHKQCDQSNQSSLLLYPNTCLTISNSTQLLLCLFKCSLISNPRTWMT